MDVSGSFASLTKTLRLFLQSAMLGLGALAELLGAVPPEPERTALPTPKARLVAKALTVVPPNEKTAALRGLNFDLPPGHAMGVIGPSGAGKSTLARCVTEV
jgi:ATP-binding cassette subfamily C protein